MNDTVVQMLDCFSPEEAAYYVFEGIVLESATKGSISFRGIDEGFGFVGGSLSEYANYFARDDLPADMWTWLPGDSVKAVAGFSVVPKKSGKLRKLLMCCAANYCFKDARQRANHGLLGGTALARLHISRDVLEVAAFDESNAFTSIRTPPWLWSWHCCPPLRAFQVWSKLSTALRDQLGPTGWVYPAYTRLPMGSSDAVHIIMDINMTSIGRTLMSSRRISPQSPCRQAAAAPDDDDAVFTECPSLCEDSEWSSDDVSMPS
jgi:hypothetical protein